MTTLRQLNLEPKHTEEANAFFISLSDVMILLCVFFIMLVSVSEVDIGSFEKVRSAFRGNTKDTLVELSTRLETIATTDPGIPGVKVGLAADGVRIDLDTAALFDSASAVPKEGVLEPLEPLLSLVLQTPYRIDVEGHSDDVAFYRRTGDELETNWSLSGRRASSVLHHLLEQSFSPDRVRIVGYADTRPKRSIEHLSQEEREEARAENRRVSLLIH